MNVATITFAKAFKYFSNWIFFIKIPRQDLDMYYGAMIEFKYLKKGEKNKLEEKQKEAKKQIEEYSNFEKIKSIPKLKKYTVIAVNDEIFVEEIV